MCPEVEDELYGKVLDARADGLPIGYRWAAQTAKSLFLEINAEADPEPVPVFSNCWVRNFMQRYDLSVRRASSSRTQLNQDPAIMESFSEEIRELRVGPWDNRRKYFQHGRDRYFLWSFWEHDHRPARGEEASYCQKLCFGPRLHACWLQEQWEHWLHPQLSSRELIFRGIYSKLKGFRILSCILFAWMNSDLI